MSPSPSPTSVPARRARTEPEALTRTVSSPAGRLDASTSAEATPELLHQALSEVAAASGSANRRPRTSGSTPPGRRSPPC
ncbi:predicted protein [Streptomyces viridosporus ATCC 14672]|uniref:Predicted protein n=1 Tax=Streptomyces viridosporus (strain ATCC 14672 / DSM 40746 / JCM 4963 / KCTC 9882 / NRRL B-12104 / FH 1290) TaxID=566461 RepID=D6A9B0_STRV1|nr:predicted protein [Streptomyces viridosporus ATCC 14672]